MIDDRRTQGNDNLISDTTFWDLYPADLSSIESVEIQSLPLSVRVLNRLMHIGVGNSMNDKEYLLREAFKSAGIECPTIASYVVFTNSSIHVDNRYSYITTCYLSQLPRMIESYNSDACYSLEELDRMITVASKAACKNSYPLPLDVKKYKTDFATLMAILESAEEATENFDKSDIIDTNKSEEHADHNVKTPIADKKQRREKAQVGAVAAIAGVVLGVAVATLLGFPKKH